MSTASPLVNVIIPAFNAASFIGAAVSNCQKQTYKNIQLVIVDDGSTDNTKAEIEKFRQRYDNIRYFYKKNQGPGKARNYAVKHTEGDYIAFLDVDDYWKETKIEKQVNLFINNPSLSMVSTRAIYRDLQTGKSFGETILSKIKPEDIPRRLMIDGCFILTSTVMIRREVFVSVQGFDETLTYAEDWDLIFRISNQYEVSYVDEVLTYQQVHPGSLTSDPNKRNKRILDEKVVVEKIYSHAARYGLTEKHKSLMLQKLLVTNARRCLYDKDNILARKYLFKALKYNYFNLEIARLMVFSFINK